MTENSENLELYRIMVGTVTANEQRRQQISSVFMTLVAAGFGAAGAIDNFDAVYATVPGAVVGIVWWLQVRYLKQLATAKFKIINRLESNFDYQPFSEEWQYTKSKKVSSSWFRPSLSRIEMTVPLMISAACACHIFYRGGKYIFDNLECLPI